MKKLQFLNRFFLSIALLLVGFGLFATNIVVSDIVIVERNDADKYIIVQCNLKWDYSFRVDDGANTNWDAAWVFMKYKDVNGSNNVQWGHATLSNTGHTIPGNFTHSLGATAGANKGVFIYPSVIFANTAEINGLQLRWDYGIDGLEPEDEVDIRVFGIEMVYVPTGSFYVGSGGNEDNRFYSGGDVGETEPFQISNSSFGVDNSAGNLWAVGAVAAGTVNANYPTGYNAFYMMKHNVTQQAYVDFLNSLTYEQQDARTTQSPAGAPGTFDRNTNRHRISIANSGSAGATPAVYETDHPYVPVNWVSTQDVLAYLDWAALRPFTELEYEKAARGPASPVPNEFAWGNTLVGPVTAIDDAGLSTERPVPDGWGRDITIDRTKVSENLTDFTVLVRLDDENFDFDKCRTDGLDIEFLDFNGVNLSFQRERHDYDAKKAEYWVKIPNVSSSQNTVFTMRYGDFADDVDGAAASSADVWSNEIVSLWHLNQNEAAFIDSKGDNDGLWMSGVTRVEGQVGPAQQFDGVSYIRVDDDATLDIADEITVSAWVKPQELTGITRTETTSADWDDYHSITNLTTAADKLAVNTTPGTGSRISKAISLDAIKRVGGSAIDWTDELGYRIEAFTTNGVFSVPAGVTQVDVLVVGGGGGGGRSATPNGSGGGGAGGVVFQENFDVTPGSVINVTVGDGGTAGDAGVAATEGGNSIFSSLTASGGGRGGQNDVGLYDGTAGGAGGGSATSGGAGGAGSQGNAGGDGQSATGGGAGGGGAGGAGDNASGNNGANGGIGVDYSSNFGTVWGDNGWFAGGGGGGASTTAATSGSGGQGGGGDAALNSGDDANAAANTGGGGGAGNAETANQAGGNGGSGIVLVRYKDPQSVRIYTAINESAVTPPDFDLNIQVFDASGTFTVPDGVTKVDVLVVAGGGAGGGGTAGGGGAGGLVWQEGYSVTPGEDITVTVGAGGIGGIPNQPGTSGDNSIFGTIEAIGGGHSSAGNVYTDAASGGSGGGGRRYTATNSNLTGGSGTAGQGYNGGNANPSSDSFGGGGGAGGVGQSPASGAGDGGIGRDFSNIFGTTVGENGWFAGGGGGCWSSGVPGAANGPGLGGLGGGGNGIAGSIAPTADNHGAPNTGGGGGGTWTHGGNGGGDGGSGVVIVRWGYATKGDPIPGVNEGDDLSGKYLWIKQELTSNNSAFSPELESLEVEVKGEAVIVGKGEDAYQLSYYNGQLRGYINNNRINASLTMDEYQHVALSYNGTVQRLFVNGLIAATQNLSGAITTNDDDLLIGFNMEGDIDEVRIYNPAQAQSWIVAERHGGIGDLIQFGGEAQTTNAVYDIGGTGGPLRVGFGATPTSSRTSAGASYWGIMELSGNLWEWTVSAGLTTHRNNFNALHGDGVLNVDGTFNTANWPTDLRIRGGQWNNPLDRLRVSHRVWMGNTYLNRENWSSIRGVRTAP